MRPTLAFTIFCVLCAGTTGALELGGAGTAEPAEEGVPLLRSRVDEVSVIFTATDRRGRFIKGLTPEKLDVLDDSKAPAIRSFRSQTDLPIRAAIVIDVSGSVRHRFRFEQDAASLFLRQIIRRGQDQAFVMGFDSGPSIAQDFTDDVNLLDRAVRSLRPGGGSAVYDAILQAARDKLIRHTDAQPVRKILILISDGEDNQSRSTRAEALEMAQRGEITVYAISTNESNMITQGDKVLAGFAEETGGRLFTPAKAEDIQDAFRKIEEELRNQYALSFRPQNLTANGKYRQIRISVKEKNNIKVRARKGYFAPAY